MNDRTCNGTPKHLWMFAVAVDRKLLNSSKIYIGYGEVPPRLDADETKRWLSRNTMHFVHAVIPRMAAEKGFRLTGFLSVR